MNPADTLLSLHTSALSLTMLNSDLATVILPSLSAILAFVTVIITLRFNYRSTRHFELSVRPWLDVTHDARTTNCSLVLTNKGPGIAIVSSLRLKSQNEWFDVCDKRFNEIFERNLLARFRASPCASREFKIEFQSIAPGIAISSGESVFVFRAPEELSEGAEEFLAGIVRNSELKGEYRDIYGNCFKVE